MHQEVTSAVAQAREALGLSEAEAADPRAVKRAYAVMLKRHRPDQDPAGFRRVRDAYEVLTTMAAFLRQERDHNAEAPAQPQAPTSPVDGAERDLQPEPVAADAVPQPVVDDALAQAIAGLHATAQAQPSAETLMLAGRQVWLLAQPAQVQRGLDALMPVLTAQPLLIGEVLGDEGVLLAFEHGHGDVAATVLHAWDSDERTRLTGFARGLLLHLGKGNGQFAMLGLRLAERLALREPALANELLNRVFLELPVQWRNATVIAEQRAALGYELAKRPLHVRQFLWEAIDQTEGTPVVPAKVLADLETLPNEHPLRSLLAAAMPDLRLGFAYARQEAPVFRYQSPPPPSEEGTSLRVWFIAAFFLFLCTSAVVRNASPAPSLPPSYSPRPLPNIEINHDAFRTAQERDEQLRKEYVERQLQKFKNLTPEQREMYRKSLEKRWPYRGGTASPPPPLLKPPASPQQEALRRLFTDPLVPGLKPPGTTPPPRPAVEPRP